MPIDLAWMAEPIDQYDDLCLGATKASVTATAERLGSTAVATTDRRHFSITRCHHTDHLNLRP